ncbi:P-loop containing nucleoside triphosphate hydrolase protein [Melampsora americana]|nr:P-loop containing nucleoside triphosphate hydrolase protein [Melampsora americana]
MLTRNQSDLNATQPASHQGLSSVPQAAPQTGRISPTKSLLKLDNEEQINVIRRLCLAAFKLEARELQLKAALSLVRGRDAFVIASTGFGKSLIPELYYLMFSKVSKPIILTLNPLDALGNDQVEEKKKHGLTAINLTRATITKQVCNHILTGKYQFIYVSPEIFLNNTRFEKMFFSKCFQDRLVLKVVDETHLIYCWGLVLSGKMKDLQSHSIHQDRTAFRPSYGNLILRFLATEWVPTLLMSATCLPQHLEEILASLKISRDSIDIHLSELTRPEIRFIRVTLPPAQKPWNMVKKFFAPKDLITDTELVPTLIYCHTQNDTFVALENINSARHNDEDTENGSSNSVRRFHADTDSIDKLRHAQDFGEGKFNIMTCTNALGLGQNWKRVRRVIIAGQTDPMEVLQMAGRAGRDRRPAVAILLVKPLPPDVKNSILELSDPTDQNDDQRMHAMAITEVCLRVSFSVLLHYGYIPLLKESQTVITETQRQTDAGMTPCICSNCHPKATDYFIAQQPVLTESNFTKLVLQDDPPKSYPSLDEQFIDSNNQTPSPLTSIIPSPPEDPRHADLRLIRLFLTIERRLIDIFKAEYPEGGFYSLHDLFSPDKTWSVCVNYNLILNEELRLYNQAKAIIAEHEKTSQEKQASQAQEPLASSTPNAKKRKPPIKVAGLRDSKFGSITGDLEAKYLLPKYGLSFTPTWSTSNLVKTRLEHQYDIPSQSSEPHSSSDRTTIQIDSNLQNLTPLRIEQRFKSILCPEIELLFDQKSLITHSQSDYSHPKMMVMENDGNSKSGNVVQFLKNYHVGLAINRTIQLCYVDL